MSETNYLVIEEVLAIHDDQITRYRGSHGIRSLDLLISAIERPKTSFGGVDLYPDVFYKASALIHSLIMNHPFTDGNKRTAVVTTARFLYINNYSLIFRKSELVNLALKIESKTMEIDDISIWLKKHSKKNS